MIQKTGIINLPEGKKIAFTLTFDFDSASVWMENYAWIAPFEEILGRVEF